MNSLHLRLPATSANLGPGFDALGLAMNLFLDIEAHESSEMKIVGTGRSTEVVSSLRRNLMLATYRALLPYGPMLELRIHNEIPLGMGCGSSAAALLAGVHLANHFGSLRMTPQEVLEEACAREGHPDNVAACFYGALTLSSMQGRVVTAATLGEDLSWDLVLALPRHSLSTSKARALLPETYSRADAVQNVQAVALLVAAFTQHRPELLTYATRDQMHQPYRSSVCPLLPQLLPLAGTNGIYSVTLSGAGPSVLLITERNASHDILKRAILSVADADTEIVFTSIAKL